MKEQLTLIVFTENKIGLLNRISSILTRRHINIESVTASESEIKGVYRWTIVVTESKELVAKVTQQIEKQIEVMKAYYFTNDAIVHQELALYKVPLKEMAESGKIEKIIRSHFARVLQVDKDFIIIEKIGHKDSTQALFDELKDCGLLGFSRSGRVALIKETINFKKYLEKITLKNK